MCSVFRFANHGLNHSPRCAANQHCARNARSMRYQSRPLYCVDEEERAPKGPSVNGASGMTMTIGRRARMAGRGSTRAGRRGAPGPPCRTPTAARRGSSGPRCTKAEREARCRWRACASSGALPTRRTQMTEGSHRTIPLTKRVHDVVHARAAALDARRGRAEGGRQCACLRR